MLFSFIAIAFHISCIWLLLSACSQGEKNKANFIVFQIHLVVVVSKNRIWKWMQSKTNVKPFTNKQTNCFFETIVDGGERKKLYSPDYGKVSFQLGLSELSCGAKTRWEEQESEWIYCIWPAIDHNHDCTENEIMWWKHTENSKYFDNRHGLTIIRSFEFD